MIEFFKSYAGLLADITTAVSVIVLIFVLFLTRKQLRAALGASAIRIFEQIYDELNDKESRDSRSYIYRSMLLPNLPELVHANKLAHNKVENVCVSLDRVGVILRNKLVPKGFAQQMYFDIYVDVFIRCWAQLEKYVMYMRRRRNNPQHYINFEYLSKMAKEYWRNVYMKKYKVNEEKVIGLKRVQPKLEEGEKLLRTITHSKKVACDKPQTRFRVRIDDVENTVTEEIFEYTVAEIGPSVGIVALDEDDNITLVGQWRYTLDKYSWEIPTGVIDQGEDPIDAAKRELQEETGLIAKNWTKLGTIDNSNGSTIDVGHLFLATELSQGTTQRDPNEIIKMDTVNLWEAIELVYENKITESLSIAAILKAGHHIAMGGEY